MIVLSSFTAAQKKRRTR